MTVPAEVAQNRPEISFYVGIDISKKKFDAALLSADDKPKSRTFANTAESFEELLAWLKRNMVRLDQVHVCMEATGTYGTALARFLYERGCRVSVVNPATVSAFLKSSLSRNKTDKADAIGISRYARAFTPAPWIPPVAEVAHLQALVRRRESLLQMRTMEACRLDSIPEGSQGSEDKVKASIEAVIALFNEQIEAIDRDIRTHIKGHPSLKEQYDLLDSIPGIGEVTAALLLAELPDLSTFKDAPALAAFAGLSPQQKESGSSVRGRSRLSKMGSARLRKAFFFPGMSAVQWNPLVRALKQRMEARGKSKMAILGAAMRKLLHIVFGVLKSGKPFDPRHGQLHGQQVDPLAASVVGARASN